MTVSFPTAGGGAGIQESTLYVLWIPAHASRVGNDTGESRALPIGNGGSSPPMTSRVAKPPVTPSTVMAGLDPATPIGKALLLTKVP